MLFLKKSITAWCLFITGIAHAQLVKYDEGAVYVDGVTLLQDANDPLRYFYLPRFPRLAMNNGTFEFLCLKYTGDKPENSGGLFHALVEFSLPDSLLRRCEAGLKKIVPGARIMGQVPLREFPKEQNADDDVQGSFEIVSAVLGNRNGTNALTRSVVTSGHAPFTPGSKAALASVLSPDGTNLLWNSFTGPTSDVSVAINGYYEAMVRAYNAIVTAEMNVVYKHFSEMTSVQKNWDKTQIRRVTDSLKRVGVIKVEVADRSAGLGIKASDQEAILNVVVNKLTELMFNAETGWSAAPTPVDPNIGFNPRGKPGDKTGNTIVDAIGAIGETSTDVLGAMPILGYFAPKKDRNPKYVTDNQYVLKDIKDIRSNKFYLNLSKSVSIKVPFHTAGNLNFLFEKLGNDPRYFRVVNMNDPDFERGQVICQVDGDFVDAFDDIINFVTVNFRKRYGNGQADVTAQLVINGNDLKKDVKLKEISYPRLGIKSADWMDYEYQLSWSYKGHPDPVRVPAGNDQWIRASGSAISLIPPLEKKVLELDADRSDFSSQGISSVNVSFAGVQAGQRKLIRTVVLRPDDKSSTNRIVMYHDKGSPVAYQSTWYSRSNGQMTEEIRLLEKGYIFLVPPSPDKFIK